MACPVPGDELTNPFNHSGKGFPDGFEEHRPKRNLTQKTRGLGLQRVGALAARTIGFQAQMGAQHLQGALAEMPAVLEPLVFDSVHRFLAPGQRHATLLAMTFKQNRTIRLRGFNNIVFGKAGSFIEAGRIRQVRPQRLGGLVEGPDPLLAMHGHAGPPDTHFSGRLPSL
jgi:hypothetical protein